MPPIYQLKNVLTGAIYSLPKGSCVIGRSSHSEIKIDSAALSRDHASLNTTDGGVVLEDLNSTNGTFVNSVRIQSPTLITSSDVITIGNHRFVLIEPTAAHNKSEKLLGISDDFSYLDTDDRTSSNTMFQSSFAKSMGVLSPTSSYDAKDDESLEALISRALRSKPFDAKRVPAVLIVKSSRRKGELIELKHPMGSDKEWAIGRSNLADVILDDPTVSNLHAVISSDNEGWQLCDNDSTNGVKVNDQLLNGGEAVCQHGDIIKIGGIELIFYVLQI